MDTGVTAVVRVPNRLPISDPALTVLSVAGLQESETLQAAIQGSDAVLFAVGPRGRNDEPVASRSTRSILGAMHAAKVERIVVVSAAPVGPVPAGESVINRWLILPLINRILRSVYADLADRRQRCGRVTPHGRSFGDPNWWTDPAPADTEPRWAPTWRFEYLAGRRGPSHAHRARAARHGPTGRRRRLLTDRALPTYSRGQGLRHPTPICATTAPGRSSSSRRLGR